MLTKQAWSVKDIFYGFRRNFSCWTRQVVPSRQDNFILPARIANHSAEIDLSCPRTELAITSHMIMTVIYPQHAGLSSIKPGTDKDLNEVRRNYYKDIFVLLNYHKYFSKLNLVTFYPFIKHAWRKLTAQLLVFMSTRHCLLSPEWFLE